MSADLKSDFLTLYIGDQLFGIPVLQIEDVLGPQKITQIPQSKKEIKGALNLRGRIVTAIDVRVMLNVERNLNDDQLMSIVLEHKNELFSLQIERIGDVLSLHESDIDPSPPTLEAKWRDIAAGIYKVEGRLIVILDIEKLFEAINPKVKDENSLASVS